MPVSCNDVWKRIIAEGIASDDECRLWADQAKSLNSQQEFTSGELLLKSLMKVGLITGYQARVIAGKSESTLRIGAWIVRGPAAHPLGKGWWLIQPAKRKQEVNSKRATTGPESTAEQTQIRWGRWLSLKDISTVTGLNDASEVLQVFRRFHSKDLSRIVAEDLGNGQLLFLMAPVTDPTLTDGLQQASHSQINPVGIMLQVSRQVAELHSLGQVHGRLAPDRILWDGQYKISVLFDPFASLSRRKPSGAHGLLAPQLTKEQLVTYVAPELSGTDSVPTTASDVYSLGMIGKWLLQTKQQKSPPSGHLTKPMEIALKKCLATDLKVRFSSAAELVEALEKSRPKPGQRDRKRVRALLPVTLSIVGLLLVIATAWIGLRTVNRESPTDGVANSNQSLVERSAEGVVTAVEPAPFISHFQVVDNQQVNWLPPMISQSINLDHLPPGAQAYLAVRPRQLMAAEQWQAALSVLQDDPRWNSISSRWSEYIGLPMEQLEQLTVGFYGSIGDSFERSLLPGLLPELAVRVELHQALPLQDILNFWNIDQEQLSREFGLVSNQSDRAYFIPPDGLSLSEDKEFQLVRRFCVGPISLMNEVIEMQGITPPVTPALQRLLDRSGEDFDFCLLASPRYLLREQRASQLWLPEPLQEIFESAIGRDSRSVMIQSHLSSDWYWEIQRIPEKESESILISQNLKRNAAGVSESLGQWLEDRPPHLYWQALAQRFPQMLKVASENSRFGAEDGIVIVNGYLPGLATSNFIIASWMLISDPGLHLGEGNLQITATNDEEMQLDFSPEEFLSRRIRIFFDQESLEKALQLLEDAANEGQSDPRQRIRFDLDSAAFEQAGITRNQQLVNFRFDNQTLHDALTEIVRRANPIPNITDLRLDEQRLVWIVKSDPQQPKRSMIMLTTKTACKDQGWELPTLFSAASD